MDIKKILVEIESLPMESQKEVLDFIGFLRNKRKFPAKKRKKKQLMLSEDKFIGIWKNRPDLENSSSWVKESRQKEW